MDTGMPSVIMRPLVYPEQAERWTEQHERGVVRSKRVEEIARLMRHADCLSLDYFLEERAAYRQLVSRCQHRGVPPPKQPKYYDVGDRVAEPVSRTAAPASRATAQAPRPTGRPLRICRPSGGEILDVY